MGDHPAARRYLEQALAIFHEVLGDKHAYTAASLNNLGNVAADMADYPAARRYYEQALAIKREALGEKHPETALSEVNLAGVKAAAEDWHGAADDFEQARRIAREHLVRTLPALNEKEQLTYLQNEDDRQLHWSLSLGLARRDDSRVAAASAGWLLNGKAVAHEVLAQRATMAAQATDATSAELVKSLLAARSQLARLSLASAKPGQEAAYRQQVQALSQQEQDLSRQLGQATGRAEAGEPWVDLDKVRRALPSDALLVEITRFPVRNFQAKGKEPRSLPAHYAAWLIPAEGQGGITVVDLGEAEKIEAAIQAAQQAMKAAMGAGGRPGLIVQEGEPQAEQKVQEALAAVGRLAFDPLVPHFGKAERLILSPDASLWLIPWGALPVGGKQYAIEKYKISYVVSGRDLVLKPGAAGKRAKPVIFADPDYDLGAEEAVAAASKILRGRKPATAELSLPESAANPLAALQHAPRLSGTAAEAAAITPNLEALCGFPPVVLQDQFAQKTLFKELHHPQVLVLSTHGFFLPDQEVKHDEHDLGIGGTRGAVLTVEGKPLENPLYRCGLLLAGCNRGAQAQTADNGILTGMEIVGTDLRGTELVVLSACETGLGQVRNGEGVAGLRQAFQLAGARAVVATLWQIPDTQSAQLMNGFFKNLAAGQSKADALRNAQLAMIQSRRERHGAAHPFFWAAFTLTGE